MAWLARSRVFLCHSEEWARNVKTSYRADFRHKRTILPPTRQFDLAKKSAKSSPWTELQRDVYFLKKHSSRHAMIRKHTPSVKKSQAAVYEYCAQVVEKIFDVCPASQQQHSKDSLSQTHDFYHFLSSRILPDGAAGFISVHGKCLIESHISDYLVRMYPRLSSGHRIDVQAHLLSFHRIGVAATTVGFVEQASLTVDVQLWKELGILQAHRTATLERLSKNENVTDRKFLKYIVTQLKRRRPATTEDLLPTMEWLRNHFFAWVSYFAQTRGAVSAKVILDKFFIERLMVDQNRMVHPLELKKQQKREMLQSTGGWATATTLEQNESPQMSIVERCVEPAEATREVNVILQHSMEVPGALRGGKIDFVEVSRSLRKTEGLPGFQSKDRAHGEEIATVHLQANGTLLGQGTGACLEQAARASCLNMVRNFFMKKK